MSSIDLLNMSSTDLLIRFLSEMNKVSDDKEQMRESLMPLILNMNKDDCVHFIECLRDEELVNLIDQDRLYIETKHIKVCKVIATLDDVFMDYEYIREKLAPSDDEDVDELDTQKLELLAKIEDMFADDENFASKMDEFYNSL